MIEPNVRIAFGHSPSDHLLVGNLKELIQFQKDVFNEQENHKKKIH
jgi:hypothetical protein